MPTFTNYITTSMSMQFYAGGAVSTQVPGLFPLALDGRPYMIDTQTEHPLLTHRWRHESIPLLRQQADPSASPVEASINPEGLWRRAQDSWHLGAGQVFRDRDHNSESDRFHVSKGINVWTKYQISLLKDTTRIVTSSNTNLACVSAGSRVYVVDGTALKYTSDLSSFTSVTGIGTNAPTSIATDGYDVWIAQGSDGIYATTTAGSTASQYVTSTVSGPIGYVKGRLMAADGASIYNVVASGALPTALFTHANTAFTWVGFAEGTRAIYAAGYSGDRSLIYRIEIRSDAAALDAPIVAGSLPDGEIVRAIYGYLGFIVLGTDQGVRFCEVDASGDLNVGALIDLGVAVRCFVGQKEFIYFGWTNYDGTSSGLGALNLRFFTKLSDQTDVPAYATDVMAPGSGDGLTSTQGNVLSCCVLSGRKVFAVSGAGFWVEHATNLVSSGVIECGLVGYGIPDQKTAVQVDIRSAALVGSYTAALALDRSDFAAGGGGSFTTLGTTSTANSTGSSFGASQARGERFEIQLTLTRGSDTTTGPTISRWTLKSLPSVQDGTTEEITVPLLIHRVVRVRGEEYFFDPEFERDAIIALRQSGRLTTLQEFNQSYSGIVKDYVWLPYHLGEKGDGTYSSEGTMITTFLRIN